jgi:ABC-type dipeptide/oligopeptide/nickel transport system permease component
VIIAVLAIATVVTLAFCRAAKGSPEDQAISDQEQLEYLRRWRERHP